MKKQFIFHILIFILAISFPTMKTYAQADAQIEKVKSILHRQASDWNKGDIDAFMNGYWESEKLQFIGSKGVTYGWKQTLANYKKGYPDRATMGQLTFDIIEVERLSRKVIMMTGKFMLARNEMEDASGHFILVWKKIKGEWVIIADHTS